MAGVHVKYALEPNTAAACCGGRGRCLNHKYLWCPYNRNKMHIHASCKIFHTSNVNVLTKEVHVISKAIRIRVNYMGLFSLGFGFLVIHYRCFDLTSYRTGFYKKKKLLPLVPHI